jgi:hypothetical protein
MRRLVAFRTMPGDRRWPQVSLCELYAEGFAFEGTDALSADDHHALRVLRC